MRILLPTIELPSARGGVGRYIEAIAKTIPEVEVVEWRRAIAASGYDAVWVHHILPIGTQAWLQKLRGGKPYVVFLHGRDFDLARRNAWKRWLTRRILRGAQRVVTNSHALAKEVAAFANIAMPMTVYPCVSDAMIAAAERSSTINHQPSTTRLLTVGRLVERKGHLKVLEAIKNDPRFDYTIVGDGPMRETILCRVDELRMADRVHLYADASNEQVVDAYRNADAFVMPSTKSASDREGFGIVYLEAALFGLPAIAVRQPGVDEAIIDGVTGVLIDDSIDALRDALGRQMTDRTFSSRLGVQGRTRVLAEFTRVAQFGRLRELV